MRIKAVIHLGRFRRNVRRIRTLLHAVQPNAALCGVVKADAYGHGAVPIARAALEAGARYLAVACAAEGLELRRAGIRAPILVLSPPEAGDMDAVCNADLGLYTGDAGIIREAAHSAKRTGKRLSLHLTIDTGMGRSGCRPEEAAHIARLIAAEPVLELAGTATHFSSADSGSGDDTAWAYTQFERFKEAVSAIKREGIHPGKLHAANSGALLFHPASYLDMVRCGIMLYGYQPRLDLSKTILLEPVMELSSTISYVKSVKKGDTISYGRTWTVPHDTNIAAVPFGYGDGLPQKLDGSYGVTVKNKVYPIIGSIYMDSFMIDIGSNTDIVRGDPVTVFGVPSRGGEQPLVFPAPDDGPTQKLDRVLYEITSCLTKRVPKVYVED
jgi:alanine racemase